MTKYNNQSEISQVRQRLTKCLLHLKRLFLQSELTKQDDSEPQGMLVSLSLIGRDVHSRRIDQVMDLDTVIIVRDPMTEFKMNIIKRIFEELCNNGDDNISISYLIADGPLKPLPKSKYHLFFHVLLHTVSSYKDSPLILVKNSWQHEAQLILGMRLRDIQHIPEPNVETVLDSPLGLKHCRSLVVERGSAYLEWIKKSGKYEITLTPITFKESHDILEICFYSVLRGASNALRYVFRNSAGIGIDYDHIICFEQVFHDFRLNKLPLDFLSRKIKLRRDFLKENISTIEETIDKTIAFLDELSKDLLTRERLETPYVNL